MNQDKIWDYFQNEGIASFSDAEPRQEFIARRIETRLPTGVRVLNIGIGGGTLEELLRRKSFSVSALDPNESAVSRLRESGIDARVGVAESLPFGDGEFDAVIASEVLEHLDSDQLARALAEAVRVLKPGAWFVGTVPFNERLSDSLTICPHCGQKFHRWGHRQFFTEATLDGILQKSFDPGRIVVRSFVCWRGGLRRVLKSAAKWILGRLGEPIASPHLYFEYRRPMRLEGTRPSVG